MPDAEGRGRGILKDEKLEVKVLYFVIGSLIIIVVGLISLLLNLQVKIDINNTFINTLLTIIGTIGGVIIGSVISSRNSENILDRTLKHNYILSIEEFRSRYVDMNEEFIKLFGSWGVISKGSNVTMRDKDLIIAGIHYKCDEIIDNLKLSLIPADYKEDINGLITSISRIKFKVDEVFYLRHDQLSEEEKSNQINYLVNETKEEFDNLKVLHEDIKKNLIL